MKVVETFVQPTTSPEEERGCFPDLKSGGSMEVDRMAVRAKLEEKVRDCERVGCGEGLATQLSKLLALYEDVFRLTLGRDPPVDVAPLTATLKHGAEPVRRKARRYSKEQRDFMATHGADQVSAGLCYRNPRSKWCSVPLIVKKPDANNFRMTVDVRPVNAQTERIIWPMPMLKVIVDHLAGAEVFFSLDFFKGYWQFALDKASQEIFSFLTDTGIYTPTRVLMGGTDNVQEMFATELYKSLLIWLDDLLGYEKTKEGLLAALERVLEICHQRGLKLNPKKFKHDPDRLKALQDLKMPVTGQDLQQFICAMNWMRMSIPRYNVIVQPMTDLMESVYKAAGGRTLQKVAKVALADQALSLVVTLAHPKQDRLICVFACLPTQVTTIGEKLKTMSRSCSLVERFRERRSDGQSWREAFSIVDCLKRADYLLHKPGGFALFTDHANLKFIVNPSSVNAAIPKYTAVKLDRWALLLMGYNYTIYDIAGDVNVWADLLSRWDTHANLICPIVYVPFKISPSRGGDFVWPSMAEIVDAQVQAVGQFDAPKVEWNEDRVDVDGMDVPVLKTAPSGFRLRRVICRCDYVWSHTLALVVIVASMPRNKSCLNAVVCIVQALVVTFFVLFGATAHATKPNEILHWDFLFMDGGYILVGKDDFSQFKWLWATDVANEQVVARCLQQWFSVFGICYHWVSGQGSHFKNEVIAELQHVLGAHHHFTTTRCPWANGTVESATKTTLKTFRALHSEWLMQLDQWRLIVPVVMLILNQSPSDTLGGVAPITAMTDLWSVRRDEVKAMAKALDSMHEQVASKSAKKRAQNRDRRATKKGVTMAQFDVGDFVLYMDVWSMTHSNLSVTWRGPAQVVRVISDWTYEIQNLIRGVAREAHSSRLNFYADDSLDVSEELLRHVARNADGHVVEDFLGCRYDRLAAYEVLVSWRGLQDIENSWEPASNLLEDLPPAFKKYVRANAEDAMVVAMAKALGVAQSLVGIVANLPFAEPRSFPQEAAQEFSSLG
ncbi:hypothetical protein H310_15126 [Aphanomyces invadans]|uniref:Chromo domain-containing protein n=1 Tax=Aphanomyces invadans TaxID=157072 RepID=A0A024T8T7_9STRA|nr:hypothetical protein H310_15126 [Aphanomyces invadans]ETV90041.1 hypothetical protein H310_15126 [Aphanomyces invadans]|eukprot:XP_008881324.1 hypothetical protein H310_15126 [Aphanomyces invadans]